MAKEGDVDYGEEDDEDEDGDDEDGDDEDEVSDNVDDEDPAGNGPSKVQNIEAPGRAGVAPPIALPTSKKRKAHDSGKTKSGRSKNPRQRVLARSSNLQNLSKREPRL